MPRRSLLVPGRLQICQLPLLSRTSSHPDVPRIIHFSPPSRLSRHRHQPLRHMENAGPLPDTGTH
jgi:hypothetical protein